LKSLHCAAARRAAGEREIGEAQHATVAVQPPLAPCTSNLFGTGPEVAGQLLSTAGDNPDPLRSGIQ
jgi:hypothetical protein